MNTDSIIQEAKARIEAHDLGGLQELFENLQQQENVDWQRIYLKVYLHSCLRKEEPIKIWLEQMFEMFDPISKIALRQTFAYGKWLFTRPYGHKGTKDN